MKKKSYKIVNINGVNISYLSFFYNLLHVIICSLGLLLEIPGLQRGKERTSDKKYMR